MARLSGDPRDLVRAPNRALISPGISCLAVAGIHGDADVGGFPLGKAFAMGIGTDWAGPVHQLWMAWPTYTTIGLASPDAMRLSRDEAGAADHGPPGLDVARAVQ